MNPLIFRTDTDTIELMNSIRRAFLKNSYNEKEEEAHVFEKYINDGMDTSLLVTYYLHLLRLYIK